MGTVRVLLALAASALIAAGCADDGDDDRRATADAAPPLACHAALEGAVVHAFGGCRVLVSWDQATNATHLELGAPDGSDEPFTLRVDLRFAGTPELTTYDVGSSTGAIQVTRLDGSGWGASATGPGEVVGDFGLSLTSAVSTGTLTAGARTYAVHGSLTATLPASPPADRAAVEVVADF